MVKKIKNYKCHELGCDSCPLRMLDCKGMHYYDKTIGKVWKEYIVRHTVGISKDKDFIDFFEKKLNENLEKK